MVGIFIYYKIKYDMANLEQQLEYWSGGFMDSIEQLKDTVAEYTDHLSQSPPDRITTVLEKPDFISQQVWDDLFIKTQLAFKQHKESCHNSMYYTEIEDGIYIGRLAGSALCYFAFRDRWNDREVADDHSLENKMTTYAENLKRQLYFDENERLETFAEVCQEYFGEENVWVGIPKNDPNMCVFQGYSTDNLSIIIRHNDFWVRDVTGVGMKVFGGFSRFKFDNGGQFIADIGFVATKKDALVEQYTGMSHPHVSASSIYQVMIKDICTGEASPINEAMSSLVDNYTNEELIYNLLLNYETLLSQEASGGVPYHYMRQTFLRKDQGNGPDAMQYPEIVEAVRNEDLDIVCNVKPNRISVDIPKRNISQYLSREGDSVQKFRCPKDDGQIYYKELRESTDYVAEEIGSFYFNEDEITVEILSHDPDHFDLSGMNENNPDWEPVSSGMPDDVEIQEAIGDIESIVNFRIIQENNVNKISHEEITEELIGLSEIGRRTNIENLPGITTAD